MRARFLILATSVVLTTTMFSWRADADVPWSGAGYYVEVTDPFDTILLAGPYQTEAACESVFAALPQNQQQISVCTYEGSNPEGSTNSGS